MLAVGRGAPQQVSLDPSMRFFLAISAILPVCLAIAGVPPLMRPRPGSDVSRCDLEDRKASIQCVMQCIQDPCCLAVTITAQCEMGYIPTDASNMDLIKEVSFITISWLPYCV